MEEQTRIERVGLVLLRDRRLLAVRLYGEPAWMLPGGRMENNDTPEQVMYRDIHAQLGVAVQEGSIMLFGEYPAAVPDPSADGQRLGCYTAVLLGEPHVSANIEELGYLTTADRQRAGELDRLVIDDLAAKNLID